MPWMRGGGSGSPGGGELVCRKLVPEHTLQAKSLVNFRAGRGSENSTSGLRVADRLAE